MSATVFNLIRHLLPRALAWRMGAVRPVIVDGVPDGDHTTANKTIRRFFEGLAGMPGDVRVFIDNVFLDLWPSTTRELTAWETQFGTSGGTVAARRLALAASWSIQGRQSPDYLQRAIHAAGFTTVFVHEWWQSGPPYVSRDPREYASQPLIGAYQCEAGPDAWQCFDAGAGDTLAPHCDSTLINDPGYIVNLDLSRRAPPPVPDDPASWPYFIYIGGETFPERAPVLASRIAELKELILSLVPAQQWIVFLVDPVDEDGESGGTFGSGGFGSGPFGT